VNAGINKDLSPLHYISIDDVARIISKPGPLTQTSKIDIAHVRAQFIPKIEGTLLSMQWSEQLYVDTVLPF